MESQRHKSRLDGRVAVVTGGASGIGLAISQALCANGATVCIMDLDAAAADKAAQNLGPQARALPCDVCNQPQVKAVFEGLFRSQQLHILVNCAGIAHVGNLESTTEEEFDRLFRVNVKGMYNCMRACIGHMKSHGGGVILNMASVAALAGLTDRFAYSMTKGAVVSMTYSVARDYLPYKIRCNCISPARVHTPFVDGFLAKNYPGKEPEMFQKLSQAQPIGRMANPSEVAALALFLCSDEAAFITGVNYPIDGGFVNLRD